ncbi:MAG: hypothetical protein EA355_16030 [Rhodobacteraceae bacterium]|nr:MAG: hypothetical protein EA355_16030 [Paracoccaceae bacterium]
MLEYPAPPFRLFDPGGALRTSAGDDRVAATLRALLTQDAAIEARGWDPIRWLRRRRCRKTLRAALIDAPDDVILGVGRSRHALHSLACTPCWRRAAPALASAPR